MSAALLPPARHGHRAGDLCRFCAGQADTQLQVQLGGAASGQSPGQDLDQRGERYQAEVQRRRGASRTQGESRVSVFSIYRMRRAVQCLVLLVADIEIFLLRSICTEFTILLFRYGTMARYRTLPTLKIHN